MSPSERIDTTAHQKPSHALAVADKKAVGSLILPGEPVEPGGSTSSDYLKIQAFLDSREPMTP